MPSQCAIAETLAPGSNASATAHALNSSDQRPRSCRGAPSRRSATASIIWSVLVPRTRRRHRSSQQLIVSATDIRPLTPFARRGLLAAYARYTETEPALPVLRYALRCPVRPAMQRLRHDPPPRPVRRTQIIPDAQLDVTQFGPLQVTTRLAVSKHSDRRHF